jgi:hypothetical protein
MSFFLVVSGQTRPLHAGEPSPAINLHAGATGGAGQGGRREEDVVGKKRRKKRRTKREEKKKGQKERKNLTHRQVGFNCTLSVLKCKASKD